MPSRWEVLLAGPAGATVPLTALMAVVSGWLDDPPGRSADAENPRPSRHHEQVRKWALGPLRSAAVEGDPIGPSAALISLHVRLLDDALSDRLLTSAMADRPVRFGKNCFRIVESPRRREV